MKFSTNLILIIYIFQGGWELAPVVKSTTQSIYGGTHVAAHVGLDPQGALAVYVVVRGRGARGYHITP